MQSVAPPKIRARITKSPDYQITVTPGLRKQKPQKSTNTLVLHTRGPFLGRSSPVVARTTPQTRKGRCPVVEKSFGMYNIRTRRIVFELCLSEKKKQRKKEERKKMNKIDFFAFGFLGLVKGYRNLYSRFSNRIAKRSSL